MLQMEPGSKVRLLHVAPVVACRPSSSRLDCPTAHHVFPLPLDIWTGCDKATRQGRCAEGYPVGIAQAVPSAGFAGLPEYTRRRSVEGKGPGWRKNVSQKGVRIASDPPVTSLPASQYISDTTTQPALISLHMALEKERILARRAHAAAGGQGQAQGQAQEGPRVMVLGPPNSGKTTAVKSLVNMACASGMGWSVGVVGLDPASVRLLIVAFYLHLSAYPGHVSLECAISRPFLTLRRS